MHLLAVIGRDSFCGRDLPQSHPLPDLLVQPFLDLHETAFERLEVERSLHDIPGVLELHDLELARRADVVLDDLHVSVEVEEEVPLDGVCEDRRFFWVRAQRLFEHVADRNAHRLVRDLEVVLRGDLLERLGRHGAAPLPAAQRLFFEARLVVVGHVIHQRLDGHHDGLRVLHGAPLLPALAPPRAQDRQTHLPVRVEIGVEARFPSVCRLDDYVWRVAGIVLGELYSESEEAERVRGERGAEDEALPLEEVFPPHRS
mmetsp:Transcript_30474/g.72475  ORF Transcript_30474/g.72475 Transcript_30474/m.72475 type:complete len:258 (-) Transcript_30474:160-933(-)